MVDREKEMEVLIRAPRGKKPMRSKEAKAFAIKVMDVMGLEGYELSLVLVGDEEMARLNKEFLGREGSTNVIAFSQIEGEGPIPGGKLLGDVVISLDACMREAEESGVPFEERFMELLVHGVLHLLGYDHEQDETSAQVMEEQENHILRALGLGGKGDAAK